MSFVIYSRKTGKYLNLSFFQEVDQESCGWNIICQILILPLWFLTPPCVLVKISQILLKVIVFFSESGEEIKASFLQIWIAQWLKFFCTTVYFFSVLAIFRKKRGVKVGPKVLTFGPSLFHNYSNPSKIFQRVFLFATSGENFGNIGPYWGSKGPKISQKGLFRGCWIGTQNLGNF